MAKEKNIYIVRHGQTDFNLKGIVQGRGVDSSLNETGFRQAQLLFEKYKDIPFDNILTSTLRRTHQTVSPFAEIGLHHTPKVALDEISWGICVCEHECVCM